MNGLAASAESLPKGLHLLNLPQPRTGFHHFISSWFFVDPMGRRVVVDPGPASTIPMLLEKLSSITDGVDLILLTHIHIDHSGGAALLCDAYDSAKVVVHGKGVRHLTNPEKLWTASLATLREVGAMYKEPKPLPPEKVLSHDVAGIEILETPGHAPHHMSFIVPFNGQRLFFLGEAAGSRLPEEFAPGYFRPATPPKFDLPAGMKSLAKIESAIRDDDLLCYAHYGAVRGSPKAKIAAAVRQIEEWLGVISKMGASSIKASPIEEIVGCLISSDPLLAGYNTLSEDLRSRERFFIENCVRGLLEYLKDSKNEKRDS